MSSRIQPFLAASLAVLALLPVRVMAQSDGGGSDAKPPKPCSQPECRQFDFWVGEWEVFTPDGKQAGTNSIQPILGGCALKESWQSAGSPFAGTSFNMYDAASKKWHQTWVDNSGRLLQMDGGIADGRMVLWGVRPAAQPGGMEAIHRITWEKKSDDEVRQLWETSSDGGQKWTVLFDGKYVRKKG